MGSSWAESLSLPSDWNSLRLGTRLLPSDYKPFIPQSVPHSGAGLLTFAITTGWEEGIEEGKEGEEASGGRR